MPSSRARIYLQMYNSKKDGIKRSQRYLDQAKANRERFRTQMQAAIQRTDKAYKKRDPELAEKYRALHRAQYEVGAHRANNGVAYHTKQISSYKKGMKEWAARIKNLSEYKSGAWRPNLG